MSLAAETDPGQLARQRAERRLGGGWADDAAWRVLLEELSLAWCEQSDVQSVMIIARGGVAESLKAADAPEPCVVCSRAGEGPIWSGPPAEAGDLWRCLETAAGGPVLVRPDVTAAGAPPGPAPDLALQVTLLPAAGRDPATCAALARRLARTVGWLTPLVGLSRRHATTAAELAAARRDVDALWRLEHLRSRLAAVAAHEMRTPLTSIVAYTDALQSRAADPQFAQQAEFLTVIHEEADRLLRMADRLLDFSRRDRSRPLLQRQPCDIARLLGESIRILAPQAQARGQTLVCRIAPQLPPVAGDPDLLQQVALNLLGNALKFSPPGGRVAVVAREDAALVRISVADHGPGIAPTELRAVFRSFYRADGAQGVAGTGLGLSIVKDIVDLHDGHVDVRSQRGRGSTFSVLLPKVMHHVRHADPFTDAGADPAGIQAICAHGLRLTAELADSRAAAICLCDKDGVTLAPTASLGLPPPADTARLPVDLAGLGPVLAGGDVLSVPGGSQGLPWPALAGPFLTDGWMAAPLVAAGRIHGIVLAAGPTRHRPFTADQAILLRVIGEALGAAFAAVGRTGVSAALAAAIGDGLRVLGGLRRGRVPTADPLALRLLAGTARALGMGPAEIRRLQYAAALHDVGMMDIDPDIVQKAGSLSRDELDQIGQHPARSLDLLGPLAAQPELRELILHHHERIDGTGYPDGRSGGQIPLGARVLAVVDAFFAMARNRPWRERRRPHEVVAEIRRHAGTQFDPRVVEVFVDVLAAEGLLGAAGAAVPVETQRST